MENAYPVVPPRQTRLLGATVRRLGTVVTVVSTRTFGYALIEGSDRVTRRTPFTTLKRGEVEFPLEFQRYITRTARVDYGVWDKAYTLDPADDTAARNVAA